LFDITIQELVAHFQKHSLACKYPAIDTNLKHPYREELARTELEGKCLYSTSSTLFQALVPIQAVNLMLCVVDQGQSYALKCVYYRLYWNLMSYSSLVFSADTSSLLTWKTLYWSWSFLVHIVLVSHIPPGTQISTCRCSEILLCWTFPAL